MGNVLFEAEDGPLPEVNGLVDDGAEDLGVVKWSCCWLRRWLPWLRLVVIGGAGWLVDLRSLENLGFDGVWLEVDLKVPLLDFFGFCDHAVERLDASDPLWWLLEEALPDVRHDPLVLSDLCWDADEGAELRW